VVHIRQHSQQDMAGMNDYGTYTATFTSLAQIFLP